MRVTRQEGAPGAGHGSGTLSRNVDDAFQGNPPAHGTQQAGPAGSGGRGPPVLPLWLAGDLVAVSVLMLGSVSMRSPYRATSPAAPCCRGGAPGEAVVRPLTWAPAGVGGVQVSIIWGTLTSTPRPPVSFYIGLFMQMVQELLHLALMLGAPATYSRHRTSLLLAARVLFWLLSW